jgi:hypothetical protein
VRGVASTEVGHGRIKEARFLGDLEANKKQLTGATPGAQSGLAPRRTSMMRLIKLGGGVTAGSTG